MKALHTLSRSVQRFECSVKGEVQKLRPSA